MKQMTMEVQQLAEYKQTRPIVVVEDDQDLRSILVEILSEETFYPVLSAQNPLEALDILNTVTPSLLILDYQLPMATGLQLYDRLHETRGLDPTQVFLMSANLPFTELKDRHLRGMQKPFELEGFLELVEQMLTEQEPSQVLKYPVCFSPPKQEPSLFTPPQWLL